MALVTKPNVFTAGATILSAEHNENFDTLYNLVNGNIDNNNIKSSAAIVDTKLAQITTASKVSTSAITDDDIDLAEITADALILEEGTAPTTAANQGAVYTKNDGTQTELYFREESAGDEVKLTSGGAVSGISGVTFSSILDYGTSSSASTSKNQSDLNIAYGTISIGADTSVNITNLPFTSSSTYSITAEYNDNIGSSNNTHTAGTLKSNGSTAAIYNGHSSTAQINWFAIGT